MKQWLCAALWITASATASAYDCDTSYAPSTCANIKHTWNDGSLDGYLPVWTWHNRAEYDRSKITQYNEQPWGFGVGKHYYDSDGDRHMLYAMGFLDSHDKFEPITGYSFEKIWRPGEEWKLGLGYTVFVTARSDIGSYTPFPAILPLWSVQYRKLSVQQTYVPGGHNNGNILFTWLRYEF